MSPANSNDIGLRLLTAGVEEIAVASTSCDLKVLLPHCAILMRIKTFQVMPHYTELLFCSFSRRR